MTKYPVSWTDTAAVRPELGRGRGVWSSVTLIAGATYYKGNLFIARFTHRQVHTHTHSWKNHSPRSYSYHAMRVPHIPILHLNTCTPFDLFVFRINTSTSTSSTRSFSYLLTGYGPCHVMKMTTTITDSINVKLVSASNYYAWKDNIADCL